MKIISLLLLLPCFFSALAQPVTGVWKGRIDRQKVEVKIIQNGDSLTGTSYYYESPNAYRRYTIKGYFDQDNSVVWWDDQLIAQKGSGVLSSPGKNPFLSVADFNCPGSGRILLNGKTVLKEAPEETKGPVDLAKTTATSFPDEWDFIIDNYTVGANDPYLIDSVGLIATAPRKEEVAKETPPLAMAGKPQPAPVSDPPAPEVKEAPVVVAKPLTIEEKFITRKKIFTAEIPVEGDSIELRFYDNAQVDGDSISLFLDNKMIFQHIKLLARAYTIKLPTASLTDSSELIMVAENLGSIPPNTAYMVAIVGNQRYEANLTSTEETSAQIKLRRKKELGSMK